MPAIKETTILFYDSVKKEYLKLASVKDGNARVYTHEFCLNKVAKKFFRSPKTIENIVFDRA